MDKKILASTLRRDEAKAFGGIEPESDQPRTSDNSRRRRAAELTQPDTCHLTVPLLFCAILESEIRWVLLAKLLALINQPELQAGCTSMGVAKFPAACMLGLLKLTLQLTASRPGREAYTRGAGACH